MPGADFQSGNSQAILMVWSLGQMSDYTFDIEDIYSLTKCRHFG